MPSMFSKLALERNTREVRIVLMPHWAMADAMASLPAVKFRFTGTLPAKRMAMLTSEPPTEAGKMTPTIDSRAQCFFTQRASSMAPIKVLP